MSKISLRAYNREIETLIERGHTEEAIAHCKYILKTFAKHLDTYRLLGKAFLESQRYGEAADILNRILSVLPDDFVAQIGMSIIREDEGNLDAAIFHMERSFEIQPSNAAIQDELRRLYGRRDGMEPPKLRLTRGALVRMYARGDLYRQAIAEARAAIKEDPQRLDLEIVLARMYYQTGQKAEAAEICSRLVMKLPYCMEANRILADVLPETSRADDAKIYQQRLAALEPYLSYQSDPSQNIQQVPDNAVSLDRLEWIPSLESAQQPAWANTLGLEIEDKEQEQMPEWLSGLSEEKEEIFSYEDTAKPFVGEQEPYQSPFTSSVLETSDTNLSTPDDQIPGFAESTQESQPEPEADLPDWMQGLGETTSAPDEEKLPDWMQSSGWEVTDHPSEELPPSVAFDAAEEVEDANAAPADIPDWLKDLAPASGEDNLPEPPALPVELPVTQDTPKSDQGSNLEDDLPDWLKSPSSMEENIGAQSQEPLPDWLTDTSENLVDLPEAPASTDFVPEIEHSVAETQPTISQIDGDLPDNSLEEKVTAVSDEAPPQSSSDVENMDDAMAWLESLAAKQGADEETLLTKPEERVETPPDWVMQAADSVETAQADQEAERLSLEEVEQPVEMQEPSPQLPPVVVEEVSPPGIFEDQIAVEEALNAAAENVQPEPVDELEPASSGDTDQADMDSAFAWLESLAAKQGAEPDSLLVSSENRLESPPDWIKQESAEIETEVEQKAVEPPTGFEEETPGQMPDWMTSAEQIDTPAAEIPTLNETLPDWLQEENAPQDASNDVALPITEEISRTTKEVDLSVEAPANEDSETDWGKELEASETKVEEFMSQPPGEPTGGDKEEAPSEVVEPEPLPEWLTSEISDTSAALEETSVQEDEPQALPDWLQTETPMAKIVPGEVSLTSDESETPSLPDWLKDLESEQEAEPLPIETSFNLAPAEIQETGEISQEPNEMILQAQSALGKGQIEFALSIYQLLIDQEQKMDETIHDLRDALYRYPVDSVIWQTLGDAYMRTNQVQEALDAFTKAEELLK